MAGYMGIASDIVKKSAELDEIAVSLLGRVVLVDNIDNARSMARACRHSTRLVTLEGDVMNPGGSMTGGYQRHNSSGLLGRSRDIERLSKVIEELEEKIAKSNAMLATADDLLKQLGRASQENELKLTDLTHQRVRDEAQISSLKDEFERLSGRCTLMEQETSQLGEQDGSIDNQQRSLEAVIEQQLKEIELLRIRIGESETANKSEH
jgi:chromosome segregation protein